MEERAIAEKRALLQGWMCRYDSASVMITQVTLAVSMAPNHDPFLLHPYQELLMQQPEDPISFIRDFLANINAVILSLALFPALHEFAVALSQHPQGSSTTIQVCNPGQMSFDEYFER